MKEIITKIEEVNDDWEGFRVTTSTRTIDVAISNSPNCCESWGHLASVENTNDYVGAELISVSVVDTAFNKLSDPGDIEEGTATFVNFVTDRGTLQLTVYDAHNGYYGHSVKLSGLEVVK